LFIFYFTSVILAILRKFFDLYYITSRSGESKRAEAGGALLGCGKKLERGGTKANQSSGKEKCICTALHCITWSKSKTNQFSHTTPSKQNK
jgi:hypothetical protein